MAAMRPGLMGAAHFLLVAGVYALSCAFVPHALANRLVSSANATLIFLLAVAALAGASDVSDAPPIAPLPAAAMECMCAFLAFDVLLGMARGFESSPALMLVHHTLGLASELTSLWFGLGSSCAMVVHLAECSTPLLHLSWLMLKRGCGRTRAFFATGATLVLAFLLGRVLLPAALLARMARPRVRAHWGDHDGVYRFHVAVVLTFWLINCYWFAKLLRATRSAGAPAGPTSKESGSGRDAWTPTDRPETAKHAAATSGVGWDRRRRHLTVQS
ncbi:hypothetical protein KFE25_008435 [Diacronema lutheri]|uniref:TLC domain-containing protein n=1 Tax=Diacronema lutheri TaxID=2081491 RepID=A0A8J5X8K8_DIALT|nr:hypothetical protein KFE25_008435 [Diacronema lutheri]|mmetsp:Transcript_17516/g.54450  ORF Transcript_17516/g.54450 Transcript_17516/m.54450 type:complete len:273 (-) Transcript_17516:37-855(-)